MNSATLRPNVQDLQTDVVELLRQISALMHRASTALSAEETGRKYAEFHKQVAEEASKVENLELIMAIVAPSKAGKSTIINAIIGQDLLPSRNAAMTTLPTEIVFNAELTEPTLTLSDEILLVFANTLEALRHKIQTSEPDWIREKIAQYPHLMDLLQKIKDPVGLAIPAQTSGFEQIKKTLTDLNDIIRLCSLLEQSKDPLGQLINVPRIETPFWRSQKADQPEKIGNLVIVDTPGPNEAGLRLAAVVAQLRQSSIVLIVLDFTQLKTKAAQEVKQDVQKVIELRGKENLYVLINKVDQRTDNDMTPEQVRQFVAAELGIGDGNTDRVFEIAAISAFCATNFLLEVQHHPGIDIAANAEELKRQVAALDEDLRHLELCRSRLKEVDRIKTQLRQKINNVLNRLSNCQPPYELLQEFSGQSRTFNTQGEAQDFQYRLERRIRETVYREVDKARDNNKKEVDKSHLELISFLERETNPILEQARTRLNEAFNVNLEPPRLDLADYDIGSVTTRRAKIHQETKRWVADMTVYERRWYTLWLWEHKKSIPVNREAQYYIIYSQDIVDIFKDSIEQNVKNIKEKIHKYIDEDFQQQINSFFEHLDRYSVTTEIV